jgi:glutaminyl-peptide cyclotransferase
LIKRAAACIPLLLLGACSPPIQQGEIEVLEVLPHDTTAYTQGLVFDDGVLYESTGQYGSSTIRRVDPSTGQVLSVEALDSAYFGEGLALLDDRLVQLTWKEHVAFVYDLESLETLDTIPVATFGWGLCSDGQTVFMTGGGSTMYRLDPASWEERDRIQVERDGVPLWEVNELECVGSDIYANVYQSDVIVKIDAASGMVLAEFDAAALVPDHLRGSPDAVLNGIAYDRDSDSFYLTGKLWPVVYRVRLSVE